MLAIDWIYIFCFPSVGAAFELRQIIIAKFEMQPDVGTLVVTMMDLFLKDYNTDKAKVFTEECIIGRPTLFFTPCFT